MVQEIMVYDINGNSINNLVQWDSDVYIYLGGAEIDSAYQVHFFNNTMDKALVVDSTFSGGKLRVKIPNNLLIQPHTITGYVNVTKNGQSRCMYGFRIYIRRKPKPLDFIYTESDDYVSIEKIRNECKEWAQSSQSWAVGGTGMREGEDADNAKYYSQQSKSFANAASVKASEAANSASDAEVSKTNAANSEAVAAESATAAENAKTAAQTAKSAAEDAQAAASSAKTEAQTAAEDARTLATAAAESANSAADGATAAAESASTAESHKAAAEQAKVAAEAAKDGTEAAKNAAVEAQRKAETAQSEAETAKSDAVSAKNAAESSASDVASLKAAAENAKTDAQASAAAAYGSATAAENAKTAAQTAKSAAEDAQAAASSAKTEAQTAAEDARTLATAAAESAVAAEEAKAAAEFAAVKTPYVGDNGNWMVWDQDTGEFVDSGEKAEGPQGPQGDPGKTAYQYAVEGGYTGTEAEFTEKLKMEFLPTSGGDMTGPINMNGQPLTGLNPPTGETEAATKGYVDGAVRTAAPVNLMDNSYFLNPVNQRGQAAYSGQNQYFIDRWVLDCGDSVQHPQATLTKDGIKVSMSGPTGYVGIYQRIAAADLYKGQRMTAAVKTKEYGIRVANFTFGENHLEYFDNEKFYFIHYNSTWVYFRSEGGTSDITYIWAALYPGEYTADTLPEYQPKGYWAELAECQRYYIRWSAYRKLGIAVPMSKDKCLGYVFIPEMRTAPSIMFENMTLGSDARPVSAIVLSQMSPNMVELTMTQSGTDMTVGSGLTIRPSSGGYCEFIADL